MRAWIVYPEVEAWEVHMLDMWCAERGALCQLVRVHRFHECFRTKLKVMACVGEVVSLGSVLGFPGHRLCPWWRAWGDDCGQAVIHRRCR